MEQASAQFHYEGGYNMTVDTATLAAQARSDAAEASASLQQIKEIEIKISAAIRQFRWWLQGPAILASVVALGLLIYMIISKYNIEAGWWLVGGALAFSLLMAFGNAISIKMGTG
jgi:hypothetical protein